MSKQLQDLLSLHQLEKLEVGLFRGECEHLGLPQVYGGQVVGQALSAAGYTVDSDRTVHSFHSYFYIPAMSINRLFMMLKSSEMARAYPLVASKRFNMADRFFILLRRIKASLMALSIKSRQCLMCQHLRTSFRNTDCNGHER